MAKRKKKTKSNPGSNTSRHQSKSGAAKDDADIPTPSTVVDKLTLVSKSGHKYSVLRTNQTDPYDPV